MTGHKYILERIGSGRASRVHTYLGVDSIRLLYPLSTSRVAWNIA